MTHLGNNMHDNDMFLAVSLFFFPDPDCYIKAPEPRDAEDWNEDAEHWSEEESDEYQGGPYTESWIPAICHLNMSQARTSSSRCVIRSGRLGFLYFSLGCSVFG